MCIIAKDTSCVDDFLANLNFMPSSLFKLMYASYFFIGPLSISVYFDKEHPTTLKNVLEEALMQSRNDVLVHLIPREGVSMTFHMLSYIFLML